MTTNHAHPALPQALSHLLIDEFLDIKYVARPIRNR